MMLFEVITLFPGIFTSPLNESILKRAKESGLIKVKVHNLRDFTFDRHRTVDDCPYGGGAGMVMKPDPIVEAIEKIKGAQKETKVILMTPQGEKFNQNWAIKLARHHRLIFVCGRYEGIDERVKYFVDEELSVGDYILTGGELAALVVIDAVSRLIPGVLGDLDSAEKDTFFNNLLKYPQYTRPQVFRGLETPDILLSGNHQKISDWRRKKSLKKTYEKRPDLLEEASLSEEDKKIIEDIKNSFGH